MVSYARKTAKRRISALGYLPQENTEKGVKVVCVNII